jgi:hypothetical protein
MYIEFPKLEVEFTAYPPVYGAPEPGSGGLNLSGPSKLSEKIHITAVNVPISKDRKLNIVDALTSFDLDLIEEEILAQRKE